MGTGSSTAGGGLLSPLAILTTFTVRACDKGPSQHRWARAGRVCVRPLSTELVRWLDSRVAGRSQLGRQPWTRGCACTESFPSIRGHRAGLSGGSPTAPCGGCCFERHLSVSPWAGSGQHLVEDRPRPGCSCFRATLFIKLRKCHLAASENGGRCPGRLRGAEPPQATLGAAEDCQPSLAGEGGVPASKLWTRDLNPSPPAARAWV